MAAASRAVKAELQLLLWSSLNLSNCYFFIHCSGTEINSEKALAIEFRYWCENKTSLPFPVGSSRFFEPEMLPLGSAAFVFKPEWF